MSGIGTIKNWDISEKQGEFHRSILVFLILYTLAIKQNWLTLSLNLVSKITSKR